MPGRTQSRGTCTYCGAEVAKGSVTKHLAACTQRQAVIAQANQGPGAPETLYHLRVQDEARSEFWLDLEMRGSRPLSDLDRYLRRIWLECCGHLSQFSIGGWQGDSIAMRRPLSQACAPGVDLTHIYDFGTSSFTLIKAVATRTGHPTTRHPIALMARNLPPQYVCITCGQPAQWLCMECLIEEDVWGTLCNEHARDHPHEDYGDPFPLVNSPRLGLCGYTGPAEPPY